ncbi:MAG TPA: hypothetical protein VN939_01385 [Chthoniobacterales bacterium]|nr:hypothetical protein [Chthoniobacterales bacterium]
MALSASLEVINNTGSEIVVSDVDQVNDDSTWNAPSSGTVVLNGQSVIVAMGNSSVFLAPQGCGCNFKFTNAQSQTGNIYLDVPAVGEHTLNGGTVENEFTYSFSNPTGNSYIATISAPNSFDQMVGLKETSSNGPAIAYWKGMLFISWTGVGNDLLNVMYSTDNGKTFSHKYISNETSAHAPALCTDNEALYIAWTGTDNRINLATISTSGSDITGFANKATTDITTPFGPALASYAGKLHLAWTGENKALNLAYSTDGKTFPNRYSSPETSTQAPTLCANNVLLFIAWKGDGNDNFNVASGVFSLNPNYTPAFGGKIVLSETSPLCPALTYDLARSRIYIAWKGDGNDSLNLMYSTFVNIGDGSGEWQKFGDKLISTIDSPQAPALCNNGASQSSASNLFISWIGEGASGGLLNVAVV